MVDCKDRHNSIANCNDNNVYIFLTKVCEHIITDNEMLPNF